MADARESFSKRILYINKILFAKIVTQKSTQLEVINPSVFVKLQSRIFLWMTSFWNMYSFTYFTIYCTALYCAWRTYVFSCWCTGGGSDNVNHNNPMMGYHGGDEVKHETNTLLLIFTYAHTRSTTCTSTPLPTSFFHTLKHVHAHILLSIHVYIWTLPTISISSLSHHRTPLSITEHRQTSIFILGNIRCSFVIFELSSTTTFPNNVIWWWIIILGANASDGQWHRRC